MIRPIDKLSSESFVGVAALLLCTESEHGKLFESVVMWAEQSETRNREEMKIKKKRRDVKIGWINLKSEFLIVILRFEYYLSMF